MRPISSALTSGLLENRSTRRSALRGLGGGALAAAALAGGHRPVGVTGATATAVQAESTNSFAYKLESSAPVEFDGGLARVATSVEFPALAGMAIRSEHLDAGALQSPHWHPNAGEVHYIMSGTGTAGIISPGGERATFDLRPGSVSFFPKGHYHYVHNTGTETMRVLAAFTHESPTQFTAGDVVGMVPGPILAQVLGVAPAEFPDVPDIASRAVVALPDAAEAPPIDPAAVVPEPYTLNLDGLEPAAYEGGTVTNVRGKELARLDGICFLPLYIDNGGVREPHWHPNAAELIYINGGEAEIGLVGTDGLVEHFTIGPGDLAYFPTNWFHYVASVGSEPLDSIVWLSHAAPSRIDLSDMVAFTPRAVTAVSIGLEAGALAGLPDRPSIVVAGANPAQ